MTHDLKRPFLSTSLVIIALMTTFSACRAVGNGAGVNPDTENRVAAALASRGLYKEAETTLRRVIESPAVPDEQKAKALYQIGVWHLEQGRDAQAALAAFVELRERFGALDIAKEAAKKEVACLDKLGRPLDAKGVLDESARVEAQKPTVPREGAILAKIGDREITSGDLDAEIRRMPPEAQKQMTDKTAKKQILQSLIARELLYDSAVGQGLDKDAEVLRSTSEAKKGIMVMSLINKQTKDKVHVDPVDVKNYYEANKDKLKDKEGKIPAFEAVADKLAQSLAAEKKSGLVQQMIQDLVTSRGVQVFDEKL